MRMRNEAAGFSKEDPRRIDVSSAIIVISFPKEVAERS